MATAMLEQLVRWYMQQYGYTRDQAIASIRADLRDMRVGVILRELVSKIKRGR